MSDALSLINVQAFYGDSHILHGVSFSLQPGGVLALLGRNGAGKTTCISTIIGFLEPRDGEIRLDAFFAMKGEPIDWQTDAHATPNAFSPLCGFTATFVLNQAGSHFGLAWYNETGTAPAEGEIARRIAG